VNRAPAAALAAGLVLADSSIVTLALPEILRELDAGVGGVAWVLIGFNLALALAAVPAAALAGRSPARARCAYATGLVAFAGACVACAAAPSLGVLIGARAAQGIAGAVVVAAALGLLRAQDADRALSRWVLAGIVGAALGPAAGGLLTEALSWEAMFALQAPVALAALAAAVGPAAAGGHATPLRPMPSATAPLLALAVVSAALAAALFLLVVLLIEGWRHSPAEAAATVTVMPVAALAAPRLARALGAQARGAAGAVLLAGGLAALGLLPDSSVAWTIAPQVLVGAGLGLTLPALTGAAVPARAAPGGPAAWTIAARSAGVVAGLLVLTPIFTADLERQRDPAERAGVARLLDARLSLATKVRLAVALDQRVDATPGRLPDLGPAFAALDPPPAERPALRRLRAGLEEELDRAGTAAFARSFLVAAALAALTLVPVARTRRWPA